MRWWGRSPEPEQRAVSIADPAVAMLLGYGDGTAPSISEQSALTLSSVYRSVALIAGTIASLPLRTLQDDSDGIRKRVPSVLDAPAGKDRLTPYEWKELVLVHLLLHGNAYLQHVKNGAGALIGLWPIHPLAVEPEWDNGVPGGKRFVVTTDDGTTKDFDGSGMTQIMGLSLDGLRGLSPIALARLSMGTALSGDKAANRMFANGAMVGGIITPEEDVTEDEAKEIKAGLDGKMAGTDKAGALAVVNRKLKFQQWQLSAEDAQFLQSRAFQIEEVARWYGVPPHLLGQTDKQTSWGTGVAEQNRGLARYTLTPWTSRMEERLTRVLPSTRFAEFDYTAFVKPSPEVEIDLLLRQVAGGLLTPDEARHIRNLPPLPGGVGALPRTPAPSPAAETPTPAAGEGSTKEDS